MARHIVHIREIMRAIMVEMTPQPVTANHPQYQALLLAKPQPLYTVVLLNSHSLRLSGVRVVLVNFAIP